MTSHTVSIQSLDLLTHDVLRITTTRPRGYVFLPGQATDVSINEAYWSGEKRPFSFTNLPGEDHLEFIIKIYPEHKGVTAQLRKLGPGDELVIGQSWGAIAYRGKGLFIAGGAGITPFISIFRHLEKEKDLAGNKLVFANKMKKDIILESELKRLLGDNMVNILSGEFKEGYLHGFVNAALLREYTRLDTLNFYVCGPPPMMDQVQKQLTELGVAERSLITEL